MTVRAIAGLAVVAATAMMWSMRTEAHKPITSPFTFNDDVRPIMQERCAECHSPGGVAPMSLLTHADAVPWGESIRVELMAGHMPPWGVDSAAGRFRNLQPFTAREMNVLLTWASGGTPAGTPAAGDAPPLQPQWSLGSPDLTFPLREVTLAADAQEQVEEFAIAPPPRSLRAVDLLPGTPAIVRRASISVRLPAETSTGLAEPERLLALWLPGDHAVALEPGIAFDVPAGATLVVRIHYRKTWQYERRQMTDRSSVGLYFAEPGSAPLQVLRTSGARGDGAATSLTTTINRDVQAVALYADADLSGARVTVVATRPDGARDELIAFRPRAEWARRFWFREPIALPRGTRINVTAAFDQDALLPPAATRPSDGRATPTSVSLILNVVPAR